MELKRCARTPLRLIVLCGAVALAMAASVSSASANRFLVNEDDFLITWTSWRWSIAGQAMSCPVILHGSFHSRTVDKSAGSLDGHITSAAVTDASCFSTGATMLTGDLPWHFQYDSFMGELPEIASVTFRIVGIRASIDPFWFWLPCLWGTTASDPFIGIAELDERGAVTGFRIDETRSIAFGRSFLCEIPGSLTLSGIGFVRIGDDTNPVVLTLI